MTLARAATAAVLAPLVVAAVWWGSDALLTALAGLVTLLALMEFFALADRIKLHGYKIWTGVCAIGVLFQQWALTEAQSYQFGVNMPARVATAAQMSLELVLFVFVLGAAAVVFVSERPLEDSLGDLSISSAGLLLIVLPFSTLIRLDAVPLIGRKLVLFTLALVWAGDTLAYFVGRWFGRVPMAPKLSPKKTWEGAAANLVGSLIVGLLFARWLQMESRDVMLMAGAGNIAGQVGDLFESAYKRSAGAKDSGTILPGHGGMLDRVDALILAAPAVWYYFHWMLAPHYGGAF